MTTTHTQTHVRVTFANPHLICRTCREPVPAWHEPSKCGPGCALPAANIPCGHLGAVSACPSWGPVDGCQCAAVPGHVPHAAATREAR